MSIVGPVYNMDAKIAQVTEQSEDVCVICIGSLIAILQILYYVSF